MVANYRNNHDYTTRIGSKKSSLNITHPFFRCFPRIQGSLFKSLINLPVIHKIRPDYSEFLQPYFLLLRHSKTHLAEISGMQEKKKIPSFFFFLSPLIPAVPIFMAAVYSIHSSPRPYIREVLRRWEFFPVVSTKHSHKSTQQCDSLIKLCG